MGSTTRESCLLKRGLSSRLLPRSGAHESPPSKPIGTLLPKTALAKSEWLSMTKQKSHRNSCYYFSLLIINLDTCLTYDEIINHPLSYWRKNTPHRVPLKTQQCLGPSTIQKCLSKKGTVTDPRHFRTEPVHHFSLLNDTSLIKFIFILIAL